MGKRQWKTGRDREDDGPGEDAEPAQAPRGDRRHGWGLTGSITLLISGGVLYLAWWIAWERSHPASSVARQVAHGDAGTRLSAIRRLEQVGPHDPEVAVPALLVGLQDPVPANRLTAIEVLVTLLQAARMAETEPGPIREAAAAVLARLDDGDPSVRAAAARGMLAIAMLWQGLPHFIELDDTIAALTRAADDPDAEVRLAAIYSLGPIGQNLSADPSPRLVAALEDPSKEVRTAAVQVLLPYRRGLVNLFPALVHSFETTREECRPEYLSLIRGLSRSVLPAELWKELLPALVAALDHHDRELRCRLLDMIREGGSDARPHLPVLLKLVSQTADDPGPTAIPDQPWLTDPVAAAAMAVRGVAGLHIAYTPEGEKRTPALPEAVPPLIALLRSPSAGRRLAALWALRGFEFDDTMMEAISPLCRDPDATVRATAILGLQYTYSDRYRHDNTKFRRLPLEMVQRALDDPAPEVRRAGAGALFRYGPGVEPMIPTLIRLAEHDPEDNVRRECASVLTIMGPPDVTAAVVPPSVAALERRDLPVLLRTALISAMVNFGPDARAAVPAIISLLRTAEREPRHRSLPHIPPVVGPLPGAPAPTATGDISTPSGATPQAMMASTPPVGGRSIVAFDDDVTSRVELRRAAAMALGRLAPGTPMAGEAVSVLILSLDDPDDEVRIRAVEALINFGAGARPAAPALERALTRAQARKDPLQAGQIAEALGRIDPRAPESATALAILAEALNSEDHTSRAFAERVLALFGPAASATVPRLVELSRRRSLRSSAEIGSIATALGAIAPGTAEDDRALAALLELICLEPECRGALAALEALARFGPSAAQALPRLRTMAESGAPEVRQAAAKAVESIEGKTQR